MTNFAIKAGPLYTPPHIQPAHLFWTGEQYLNGWDVPKNLNVAISYFSQADQYGHAKAKFMLGQAYYERYKESWIDTDRDLDEALIWFDKASQAHDAEASYTIAKILLDRGKDEHKIGGYFLKAMENNFFKRKVSNDNETLEKVFTLSEKYRARHESKYSFLKRDDDLKTAEELFKVAYEADYPKAVERQREVAFQQQVNY